MRILILSLLIASPSLLAEPSEQRKTELTNLLKHDCGSCHGLTLKGGLGPSLLVDDLANKSDNFLINTIQNGRTGTPMPPWKDFLNIDETQWLVQYLKNQL